MDALKDIYNRSFKTLRLSLLDTCNLSCIYCTCGNEDVKQNYQLSKGRSLPALDLINLIKRLHGVLGLETIRFTGGEPLIHPDLVEIVRSVRDLGMELKLTTNGVLLEKLALPLKEAGITAMNVSLDAIDEGAFFKISRRSNVDRIIKGIEKAKQVGIDIKLNAVIMRGVNEDQILPLSNFAFVNGIKIRFLEIMSMGHLFGNSDDSFFSQQDILTVLSTRYNFTALPRTVSATSNYWKTDEDHTFGIVANESQPFCNDCNRLRLDSFGNIYGCLSDNSPIQLTETDTAEELMVKLQTAMYQKQLLKFKGSKLSMLQIGG
jgi:cyclic pyranopterin phosphate synthase